MKIGIYEIKWNGKFYNVKDIVKGNSTRAHEQDIEKLIHKLFDFMDTRLIVDNNGDEWQVSVNFDGTVYIELLDEIGVHKLIEKDNWEGLLIDIFVKHIPKQVINI